jgi:subtilisin family serine protease
MWVDGLENRQLLSTVTPESSLASSAIVVDFASTTVTSYNGSIQDVSGAAVSQDAGDTLYQYGNNWKKIALNYTITADTVIEFDFKSTSEGEVHGIGFDTDDTLSPDTFFQLFGTQNNWGISTVEQYDTDAGTWKHYTINVGEFFTGSFSYLTFGMDHDNITGTAGNNYFANVTIYENTTDSGGDSGGDTGSGDSGGDSGGDTGNTDAGLINFNDYTVNSYDPNQDITKSYAVTNSGAQLSVSGNTWKQILINYNVTADTILEFDFSSTAEGEVQGIGFDNDLSLSGEQFFKVFGTQSWGIQAFDTYTTAQGTVHYTINVGQYFTGFVQYMVFGNDHDVTNPTAAASFSNVKLYEPDSGDSGNSGGDTDGSTGGDTTTGSTTDVNFNSYTVSAFDTVKQANKGTVTVSGDGTTLSMTGNVWRYIALPTTVTSGTVIAFDFYSSSEGEVHGIGFDNDQNSSSDLFYKLFGTQTWGIESYDNYALGNGWKHYTITLSDIPAGTYQYIVFGNDHDVTSPTATSSFRNLQIIQPGTGNSGDTGSGTGGDTGSGTGGDTGSNTGSTPTVPTEPTDYPIIDFNTTTVNSYDTAQDVNGTATVLENGQVIKLEGNTWKQVTINYNVSAYTLLEFDFYSDSEGEVHGIGFDNDSFLSSDKFFQVFGTQTFGIQDYNSYTTADGWTHYTIAIGGFFSGDTKYLVLGMDHDMASPTGNSYFANIQLYDVNPNSSGGGNEGTPGVAVDAPAAPTDQTIINFDTVNITSYGGSAQDVTSVKWVMDNGQTLYIAGNGWKKIELGYNVTESTILEFDFRSAAEGEVHGIGFDTDDSVSPDIFFQVFGSQSWGQYIIDDYEYANGEDGWVHYAIPVGTYFTGLMTYLTFGMDNDVTIPVSESYFANVSLYDANPIVVTDPPSVDDAVDTIDFSTDDLSDYDSAQQGNGQATVEYNGSTLHLLGNTWQKVALPHNINQYTVLEFDFFGKVEGEVHGIGFDINDSSTFDDDSDWFFQVFGTQSYGIEDFATYTTADGWTHYVIPVGQYFQGYSAYITFASDHDIASANADVYYANVTLYDDIPSDFTSTYNKKYGYGVADTNAAVAKALGVTELTDTPYYGSGNQSALNTLNVPDAWAAGITGEGVVVAIIDTGVAFNHSDLNDNIWINTDEIAGDGIDNDGNGYIDDVYGYNFVDDNNDVTDTNGHGTLVAGVVAAENNGTGAIGVAYDAQIMVVRVLDGYGGGDFYSVLDGIYYAVDNGADVINLSLTFNGGHPYLQAALKYAQDRGVVVVMASGNDGDSEPAYPAQYATSYGIAVGAINASGSLTSWTNLAGSATKDYVVVPGVNIYTTGLGGSFASVSATSFATPLVTGIAALLKQANPNLTAKQIEAYIALTANPYEVFL